MIYQRNLYNYVVQVYNLIQPLVESPLQKSLIIP